MMVALVDRLSLRTAYNTWRLVGERMAVMPSFLLANLTAFGIQNIYFSIFIVMGDISEIFRWLEVQGTKWRSSGVCYI
jgi:hypothetical protein